MSLDNKSQRYDRTAYWPIASIAINPWRVTHRLGNMTLNLYLYNLCERVRSRNDSKAPGRQLPLRHTESIPWLLMQRHPNLPTDYLRIPSCVLKQLEGHHMIHIGCTSGMVSLECSCIFFFKIDAVREFLVVKEIVVIFFHEVLVTRTHRNRISISARCHLIGAVLIIPTFV